MDIAMDDAEVDASPSPAHQAPCMIPGGENPMLHSWQGFQEDYQRLLATGQKAERACTYLMCKARIASAKTLVEDKSTLRFTVSIDDFEEIPQEATEGCGFTPREYIHRFLGTHAVGQRSFALQVRVYLPKLGMQPQWNDHMADIGDVTSV